jgi:hypothetical protein
MYDVSSQGPTFGGGHDWMTYSTMTTGYTGTSTYTANGYNTNWLRKLNTLCESEHGDEDDGHVDELGRAELCRAH